MNTIKFYQVDGEESIYMYIDSVRIYRLTNENAYRVTAVPVEAEEVTCDMVVQAMIDNIIYGVTDLVRILDYNELSLLKAIIQEKIEDFD